MKQCFNLFCKKEIAFQKQLHIAFFITCFSIISFNQVVAQQNLRKAVNEFTKREVDFNRTAGVVVGMVNGDSTSVLAFGTTKKTVENQPDGNTVFEIGSCTKLFTASILAILKKEGKLNYEDDVSKFLNKLYFDKKDITILDLLTHHSGFPRYPKNFQMDQSEKLTRYENYTYPQLATFLKEHEAVQREERNYIYSHVNYVILTLIIEKITEQRYETVVQERLLTPLGMNDTYIKVASNTKNQIAQGYNLLDEPVELLKTEVFKGAVGYKSTANDLVRFLEAQLVYSDEILIQTIQSLQDYSEASPIKKIRIGLAWHHVQPRRRYFSYLAHSGATEGHQVYIAFMKETKTAVVVLSNSKHNLEGLGSYILEIMNRKWKRKA